MTPLLRELGTAAACVALAAATGYWLGGEDAALWCLLATITAFFLRQLWQVRRLLAWTERPLGTPTPSASGAWAPVFDALHHRARLAGREREQVAQSLDRFRRAAEAMPDGVVILDGNRAIEWMNLQAEACLGLRGIDAGGRITHLLRDPEFLDYLDSPEQRGEALEFSPQRAPGRTLQIQAAPFAAGRTLLLVRDITQLQKLSTMRRDFVANVSHELKTPLTVTLGFIETALDALPDTPAAELAGYLGTAAEQARRMQRLIDDLLTLSALETDAQPVEEAVDMAALLDEVRSEAAALSAGRHPLTLEFDGPPQITGGSRELHSAFLNLATNAVRYTPAGGAIRLLWQHDARGGACFTVIDSGIGIARQHIPRLTERFYRVDRGRSREAGGTGLGLAIVKHVLERHDGSLRIDSEPGKGSRFSACFPAHRITGPAHRSAG